MMKRPFVAVYLLVSTTMMVIYGCGGGGNGGGSGGTSPTGSGTGFNQARSFDREVFGIVPINDGSGDVFVAGAFTTYTDTISNRLIRLHADGTVAQSFPDGFNDTVLRLVQAGDSTGAMYALGWFTQFNGQAAPGFIRLNRDGTRDTNFQLAAMDLPPTAVAPIPDGSGALYIGGQFTNYGGTPIRHLARLRANGALDPTFDPGAGFTGVFDVFNDSTVMSVAHMAVEATANRRIYVSGRFGTYRGTSVPGFLRLLPSGEVDPTFVMGTGPSGGGPPYILPAEALLPTADGKIYVGGTLVGWNGESVSQGLVRVNENGSLDRSFVPPPLVTLMIGPAGDTTGDIYVAGSTTLTIPPYVLRRLRPDGSAAPDFQQPTLNERVNTVIPIGDGSGDVYAGGYFTGYAGAGANHFARVRSDGTLASTTVRGSGFSYDVWAIGAGGEGRVYVVNAPTYASSYNGATIRPVVRLLPNGTLDPAFVFRQDNVPGTGNFFSGATLARDGSRVYVTGSFRQYDGSPIASVMRLFSDGSLDRGFATGQGFQRIDPNGPEFVIAPRVVPAATPVGALYAFGEFNDYNGTPVHNLVRLTSSGALDPTFAIGSGFDGSFGGPLTSVIAKEDGSVYVSGRFDTFNGEPVRNIVRLDSNGRRDPSFVPPQAVHALAATADGGLIVNAPGTARNAVLRKLRPDGSLDSTFDADPLPGWLIHQVISLPSDRVAVVGVLGADTTTSRSTGYVMVLDREGRQDTSFGLRTMTDVVQNPPSSVAATDDGTSDFYLGGMFTRYEHWTMQRIARLNADGSAD
jgi:uncharacterized delta-60 repeat protein